MSRSPRRTRTTLVVATLLSAGLALAGCSAGAVTQTDTMVSGAAGGTGYAGEIGLHDVSFDAGATEIVPSGGETALRGTIVNEGALPDRLISVTSPYGQTFRTEGATVIAGDNALRMVGAEPGPVGQPRPDVRLVPTARLVLTGATQTMKAGPTYDVTFTFERAGTLTVPVIVVGAGPSVG